MPRIASLVHAVILSASCGLAAIAQADSTCVESYEDLKDQGKQQTRTELWSEDGVRYFYVLLENCCMSGTYNFTALQVFRTESSGKTVRHQDLLCDALAVPSITRRDKTLELEIPVPNRFGPWHVTHHRTFVWSAKKRLFEKTKDVTIDVLDLERKKLAKAIKARDPAAIKAPLAFVVEFDTTEAHTAVYDSACSYVDEAVKVLLPDALAALKKGQVDAARRVLEPLVAIAESVGKELDESPTLFGHCLDAAAKQRASVPVQLYNDLAYALDETGSSKLAALTLRDVLWRDPQRVVAYLNLADALRKSGGDADAVAAASVYVTLMTEQGKSSKIPPRALELAAKLPLPCGVDARKVKVDVAVTQISCPDAASSHQLVIRPGVE